MSTVEAAIRFFRKRRVSHFRCEGRLERKGGDPTFNAGTGQLEDVDPEVIYEGSCNVREPAAVGLGSGIDVSAAEQELRLGRAEILFPQDIDARENDVLTVTSATHDAQLVGRRYRITDVFHDGWQITRRTMGENLTGGLEGW